MPIDPEYGKQALEDSRHARQMAAVSLHQRKAGLEAALVRMSQSSPHRTRIQQEISQLNLVMGLLTQQSRGEPAIAITEQANG